MDVDETNMNIKRFFAAALSLLLVIGIIPAFAEGYGDLSDRFSDVPSLEYNGATYHLNNRMSTILVMCVSLNGGAEPETPANALELAMLLVIDDDAKMVYPLMIDKDTIQDWAQIDDPETTLADVFAEDTDVNAGCVNMMNSVNGMFPEPFAEDYVVFDVSGLPLLDGIENNEENTGEEALLSRFRAVKDSYEQRPFGDLNDLFEEMSDYIITEMKSGALMKIVDKVDRYDVAPMTYLPVVRNEEGSDEIRIDHETLLQMIIDIYYNDEPLW